MARTIRTKVSDGVTSVYNIDFALGYLNDKALVYVYTGSDYTTQIPYTWISDTQIDLSPIPTNGTTFYIRRVVDRNALVNDYTNTAILREQELDQSFLQVLMLFEEVEDGFMAAVPPWIVNGDIDMNNNDILNLNAIQAEDIKNTAGDSLLALTQAARDAAAISATNATTSESNAATSASAAATSATAAAADAVQTALDVIATAADVVSTNADAASTSADASTTTADKTATNADAIATAADAVQTALDAIATAADAVSTAADAATCTTKATEAATSATNAATSETNAATSAASVNNSPKHARNTVLNQLAVSQGQSQRSGFSATKYTGNGTSRSVATGVDMATGDFGGLVWLKSRSAAYNHQLYDTIRGTNNYLNSNATTVEGTDAQTLTAFEATGFALGTSIGVNENTSNHMAWSFQTTEKKTGVTNRNKAYTSHYNPQMGFSIVDYVGDGVEGHEIPHHLGVEPELSIFKSRTTVADWHVLSALFKGDYLTLNTTAAKTDAAGLYDYLPLLDTVQIDSTWGGLNALSGSYISYHFASVEGVSKVGKYVGTGAAGNYVDCGFKPAFVMMKNLTAANDWILIDASRGDNYLFPSSSGAEGVQDTLDFVADGFTLIATGGASNTLNDEFLFLAFAETSSDANKAWTDYDYPTTADTLTIEQNSLFNFANGYDSKGPLDTLEQVGAGITHNIYTELLTNGGFATDFTGWIDSSEAGGSIAVVSGVAELTYTTGKPLIDQSFTTIAGMEYEVTVANVGAITGDIFVGSTQANTDLVNKLSTAGNTNSYTFTATGTTTWLRLHLGGAGTLKIADASMKLATQADNTLWLYKDRSGAYGTTEVRPLAGLTRNDADKWGVVSPLDATLRTTAKHSDYESATGVALASSELAGGYYAWNAFNKDPNDIINTLAAKWVANATTGWLQYKSNERRILKSWRLRENVTTTQTPKRFTIEGSNDGLNWTAIDSTYTASDYTSVGASLWGSLQDTSANTTAYLYHRINITANNGHVSYVAIAEMEFNTILPADYYIVGKGVMYNSAATAIERVYLAKIITDTNGDVSSIENLPIAQSKLQDTEVFGDLKVRGEIDSKQVLTGHVLFDGTQDPPLILNAENVVDVIKVSAGIYGLVLEGMDNADFVVGGMTGNGNVASNRYMSSNQAPNTRTYTEIRTATDVGTAVDCSHVNVMILGGKD